MKLLNYNELKTLLLEERDKIPLTVPGARYEMNIPQPNKHGESMRAGIRIALRCMERCQPADFDDLRPKGRWENENGRCGCSECRQGIRSTFEGLEMWLDMSTLPFCPFCGADMRGGDAQ